MSQRARGRLSQFVSVLLVFTELCPLNLFSSTPSESSQWVWVNKTGSWKSDQEAAYPILARRIQKWVENLDPINVQVSSSSNSINKATGAIEILGRELSLNTEKLRTNLMSGNGSEDLKLGLAKMQESRKQSSGRGKLGPEIQNSLLVEAAYWWKLGERSKSQPLLERAIKIHPSGQLPALADWDSSPLAQFNVEAFETFVSSVKAIEPRSCRLKITTEPNFSQIRINGFEMKDSHEISLASRVAHHLEVSALGFESKESMISCSKSELQKIFVELKPIREPSNLKVLGSRDESQRESVILVEPVKDRFKLFLYSPGHEIDEIPLKYPIRLADLESTTDTVTGPIATDAAVAIFQKHKQLTMNLRLNDREGDTFSNQLKDTVGAKQNESWLKSPVFWGIVGGVLIGGAITYFATQNRTSSTISTQWE